MVDALVADTGKNLASIESGRETLEGLIAKGAHDDEIRESSQELLKVLVDYKNAASHAKRHCQKPKKEKPAAIEDAPAVNGPTPEAAP